MKLKTNEYSNLQTEVKKNKNINKKLQIGTIKKNLH